MIGSKEKIAQIKANQQKARLFEEKETIKMKKLFFEKDFDSYFCNLF